MATQGKYAVVDTTLSITDSTPISGLNGRQGDNGRIVYFALKDGRLPHNLDGQDVTLEVKDAAGKIKVVNGIYDMISATAGLFSMLIPAEVYQAAGDVEEAFLVVTDQQNLVISSIPITFTVFANGIILSANASEDYINTIQKLIDSANDKIGTLNSAINLQQNNWEAVKNLANTATQLINENRVATLDAANHFTKQATFDDGLIGDLTGNADSATRAQTAQLAKSNAIAYLYGTDIDLNNDIQGANDYGLYSQYAYSFDTPKSLKNTPKPISKGLVEVFILSKTNMLQRVTDITTNSMWSRRITNWQDASPTFGDWFGDAVVYRKTVSAFGGKLEFARIGNTVSVHLYQYPSNFSFDAFSTIYEAGFIPAGYRPIANQLVSFETGGENGTIGTLSFNLTGLIASRTASMTSGSQASIGATYLTADSFPAL